MLNFRFSKSKNAVFISHIDVLRSTNRTLRRMGIDVGYSQGFNPHMLVNLSQPLVTGVKSLCEWASIETSYSDEQMFVELYNKYSPSGFEALECVITKQKAKIAGLVTASDYVIEYSGAYQIKEQLENIKTEPFFIEIEKRGQVNKKDVTDLIHFVKVDKNSISTRLAFGNRNLRIDKFCNNLNQRFGLDLKLRYVTRQTQLIEQNDKFITVSEYLKEL